MNENLQALLCKFELAEITRQVILRFERGQPASAKARHFIPIPEFIVVELPDIELEGSLH
jgi:hypothetical protein